MKVEEVRITKRANKNVLRQISTRFREKFSITHASERKYFAKFRNLNTEVCSVVQTTPAINSEHFGNGVRLGTGLLNLTATKT